MTALLYVLAILGFIVVGCVLEHVVPGTRLGDLLEALFPAPVDEEP